MRVAAILWLHQVLFCYSIKLGDLIPSTEWLWGSSEEGSDTEGGAKEEEDDDRLKGCPVPKMFAGGSRADVHDGTHKRCFSTVTPPATKGAMPVLLWFHSAGGPHAPCGAGEDDHWQNLGKLAEKHGFALICPDAVKGQWQLPGTTMP